MLSDVAILPTSSKEENSDYAVEIMLLSRNIIFEGDESIDNKGSYIKVLHTPSTAQTIQGVEFLNIVGWPSNKNEHCINLHCVHYFFSRLMKQCLSSIHENLTMIGINQY